MVLLSLQMFNSRDVAPGLNWITTELSEGLIRYRAVNLHLGNDRCKSIRAGLLGVGVIGGTCWGNVVACQRACSLGFV